MGVGRHAARIGVQKCRGATARGAVETIGGEEGVQRRQRDRDPQGAFEKVEGVVMSGLGVLRKELSDGPGIAG